MARSAAKKMDASFRRKHGFGMVPVLDSKQQHATHEV
jgi:hypothetical protein